MGVIYGKRRALECFFPRICPVCMQIVDTEDATICNACRPLLGYVEEPYCLHCGKSVPSTEQRYCRDCVHFFEDNAVSKDVFERAVSVFEYQTVQEALMKLKYKNERYFAVFFAEEAVRVHANLIRYNFRPDAIVAVPVHAKRKRIRGYNQAELLAKELAKRLEIPYDGTLLSRNKKTTPQKKLGSAERLANLKEAFLPGRASYGIPSCVLLVDDVYTTGSTVRACAHILKGMGVLKVFVLTMAVGRGQ